MLQSRGREFLADPPPPVPDGILQVNTITQIPKVFRGLGLDPAALMARAGIDPRLLDDPRNEIEIAQLGRLFALAVAASGCGHVGLLVGAGAPPDSLGLFGLLLSHAPDVGSALRRLTYHVHLRDRGAVVPLLVSNGIAILGYEIYQPIVEGADQVCDGSLALGVNIMRGLCGAEWRPAEVQFAHRRPADVAPFQRVFGAPLRFDSDRSALIFPAGVLDRPIGESDPEMFHTVMDTIAASESARDDDLVADLRRILRVALITGKGSVGDVAEQLSLHRRTLNRRLRARGTTLRALVESMRFLVSRQLIENTRMPLTDIATTLGYADASAFTRAFRRWTGRPPSRWVRHAGSRAVAP